MKNKMKILFIGYSTSSLRTAQEALRQLDYSDFSYCLTGESCIHRLNKKHDLIFMDCNGEDFLGLDVVKKIKKLSPRTRTIMLLSRDHLKIARRALVCGAFDYILKGNTEARQIKEIMDGIDELEQEPPRSRKAGYIFSFLRKLAEHSSFFSRKSFSS